jgi:tRNA A37 threonylcarbamoyltransferase TsaD
MISRDFCLPWSLAGSNAPGPGAALSNFTTPLWPSSFPLPPIGLPKRGNFPKFIEPVKVDGYLEIPKTAPGKMEFSFTGVRSHMERELSRLAKQVQHNEQLEQIKRQLAYNFLIALFSQVLEKISLCLRHTFAGTSSDKPIHSIVLSGGVASNLLLRQMLRSHIPESIELHYPPADLCTDNAVMIAFAALDIWRRKGLDGWQEGDGIVRAKWSLEEGAT